MTLIKYEVCCLIISFQETLQHIRCQISGASHELPSMSRDQGKIEDSDHETLGARNLPQSAGRRL